MTYQEVLVKARSVLTGLDEHLFDVINIAKPTSVDSAKHLAKIVSKLSPLLGNMIEFSTVDLLNQHDWEGSDKWIRQDPGFPDALFKSASILPNPGIEIKAWFPFATEITARFKDSVTMFANNNIDVALIAWLPEHVIWGQPKIIDVLVVSGKSVAEARDRHYHKPPYYLVFEPQDTTARTANLQQTNTNGYKLQSDKCNVDDAVAVVEGWGENGKTYDPSPEYQQKLRTLYGDFVYRLDTNYAKVDRIEHAEIEAFKTHVLNTQFNGKTIRKWRSILASKKDQVLEAALESIL